MVETSPNTFECRICVKKFDRKYHLDRHITSIKHKMKSSPKDNIVATTKTFNCSYCPKIFVHASSLSKHKRLCKLKAPMVSITEVEDIRTQFEKEKNALQSHFETEKKAMQKQINDLMTRNSVAATGDNIVVKRKRHNISKYIKQQIVDNQEHKCGDCKNELSEYFQLDHIIALQFGGTDDESNLMVLCCECHAKKSIKENRSRKRIQEAIQAILKETR